MVSGVICRWTYQGLTVDIMPTDPTILGFGNPWYAAGFVQAIPYTLPDDLIIKVLSPVYFLCTKLVALRNRGWGELRVSQDLEGIVHLVDNRPELWAELTQADASVRAYIQQLRELLAPPLLPKPYPGQCPTGLYQLGRGPPTAAGAGHRQLR